MTKTTGNKIYRYIQNVLELRQTLSTEEALKSVLGTLRGCLVSLIVNTMDKQYHSLLAEVLTEHDLPDLKYLSKFIQGKIYKCEYCHKKWVINGHRFCSVECMNRSDAVKQKREDTNLKRYGVRNTFQSEEKKQKICETCMRKYGTYYPSQRGIQNADKLTEEYVKSHFIKDDTFCANDFREFFKVSDVRYFKHKFNIALPNDNGRSQQEIDLFKSIRTEDKRQNDRTLISPLEIDILVPSIKLGIEYDSMYYHSHENLQNAKYHLHKTEDVESKGYQLFHVFEYDDIAIWHSMIDNKLGLSQKIYARKCLIKEVNSFVAGKFLNENHLQGAYNAPIRYGLFYGDELVELITFSKSRYNKSYQYELARLCTKKGVCVIGGASKLFKHFIKTFNPQSVISYANRRWSCGKIYETLGFTYKGKTRPNYFYFDSHGKIYSRIAFQKSKLTKFESYSPDKTEEQIMREEGFHKIYDCGNLIYAWTYK